VEEGRLKRPALVFIGFMGAGKTTAALDAAEALGLREHDCDRLLEARLGERIETFFDREGEASFRAHEEELNVALLDQADGDVIALGGGALGSARVREALRRHTAVLVDVDLDTAWERAARRGRPLARDRRAFAELYHARASVYEQAADAVLPAGGGDAVLRALGALQALPDAATTRSGSGAACSRAARGRCRTPRAGSASPTPPSPSCTPAACATWPG
jgi:shikimate kinase/3-dehydroquinate synthase